jgi:hypothetical protein
LKFSLCKRLTVAVSGSLCICMTKARKERISIFTHWRKSFFTHSLFAYVAYLNSYKCLFCFPLAFSKSLVNYVFTCFWKFVTFPTARVLYDDHLHSSLRSIWTFPFVGSLYTNICYHIGVFLAWFFLYKFWILIL